MTPAHPSSDPAAARSFVDFSHKGAHLRICCDRADVIRGEIVRQRGILEGYIARHPDFLTALAPLPLLPGAPAIAQRMAEAADTVGVGPMAAVAGAMAEAAARAALAAGAAEAIVENGGDLFLASAAPVLVALYTGPTAVQPLAGRLALRVDPALMPLSICSSSGLMGHSLSFGRCDLATVAARDGALADAAATRAGNLVSREADIEAALDAIMSIRGISGVLIVKGSRVGLAGDLPQLVRHGDAGVTDKVSRDEASDFGRVHA